MGEQEFDALLAEKRTDFQILMYKICEQTGKSKMLWLYPTCVSKTVKINFYYYFIIKSSYKRSIRYRQNISDSDVIIKITNSYFIGYKNTGFMYVDFTA